MFLLGSVLAQGFQSAGAFNGQTGQASQGVERFPRKLIPGDSQCSHSAHPEAQRHIGDAALRDGFAPQKCRA